MRYLTVLLLALSFAASLPAVPITFTHIGVGSGNLGDNFFESALFTIVATGDTSQRTSIPGGFSIPHLSAAIFIEGFGPLTFVSPTRTYVNNTFGAVGFSRGPNSTDLFNGPTGTPFDTWDMLTSIGPIGGSGFTLQWELEDVVVDAGVLYFSEGESTAVFQAVTGVPEPGTFGLAMAALGLVWVGVRRRRP
ncbi:MAG: PEP-CTERM sorting domain-containing protein [Bryobacteraceae bacterium]|nr:PEP-CTERM sorting domain-containing protein [Bryobacteraceae bacterium]